MKGSCWRVYEGERAGRYMVFIETGLQECAAPGYSFSEVQEGCAYAPAVMDDFGNLVVVGRWA